MVHDIDSMNTNDDGWITDCEGDGAGDAKEKEDYKSPSKGRSMTKPKVAKNKTKVNIPKSPKTDPLEALTEDARRRVREAVAILHWFLVYDNINIPNRHQHQRINNLDSFDNGTAATVVVFPPNTPIATEVIKPDLSVPGSAIFFATKQEQNRHEDFCRLHVAHAIIRSSKSLSKSMAPLLKSMTSPPMSSAPSSESPDDDNPFAFKAIDNLKVHKTQAFPLELMPYNEATLAGNVEVLEAVTTLLGLPKDYFADHKNKRTNGVENKSMGGQKENTTDCQNENTADDQEHKNLKKINNLIIAGDQMTEEVDRVARKIAEAIIKCSPSTTLHNKPCTTTDTNALLFLRDAAVYFELDAAISAGDIGRIANVLLPITMMLHGGGNYKYALELLRLLYGLRYAWTDEWKREVLSSMLVNPKGVPGHWMATDMYQENNNYLLKHVFAAKGSNMSWEHLKGSISTNIRTFSNVARMFQREVDSVYNSSAHTTTSIESDVRLVARNLKYKLFCKPQQGNSDGVKSVIDLQAVGGLKMMASSIDSFLRKQNRHNAVDPVEDSKPLSP
ncbi:hypothetical protein BGZ59_003696 [Podila verticillata]|nr:hypothetical protein BGZ59_003696 [Podila verticillata]